MCDDKVRNHMVLGLSLFVCDDKVRNHMVLGLSLCMVTNL